MCTQFTQFQFEKPLILFVFFAFLLRNWWHGFIFFCRKNIEFFFLPWTFHFFFHLSFDRRNSLFYSNGFIAVEQIHLSHLASNLRSKATYLSSCNNSSIRSAEQRCWCIWKSLATDKSLLLSLLLLMLGVTEQKEARPLWEMKEGRKMISTVKNIDGFCSSSLLLSTAFM